MHNPWHVGVLKAGKSGIALSMASAKSMTQKCHEPPTTPDAVYGGTYGQNFGNTKC